MSKVIAVDWQRLNNWRQSPPDSGVEAGSSVHTLQERLNHLLLGISREQLAFLALAILDLKAKLNS